ncbi:MAG: hypothetical protein WB676_03205 [Bryobacteraceae bacterium]
MAVIVDLLPAEERAVEVRSYHRYRQGVWQTVRAHTRRKPRRYRGRRSK